MTCSRSNQMEIWLRVSRECYITELNSVCRWTSCICEYHKPIEFFEISKDDFWMKDKKSWSILAKPEVLLGERSIASSMEKSDRWFIHRLNAPCKRSVAEVNIQHWNDNLSIYRVRGRSHWRSFLCHCLSRESCINITINLMIIILMSSHWLLFNTFSRLIVP